MKPILVLMFTFLAVHANAAVPAAVPGSPMKIGIVGLVHGHVEGFLNGGSLTPAGGILNRPDVQVVGIVEPDEKLSTPMRSAIICPRACTSAAFKKWSCNRIRGQCWSSLPRVSTDE